ncbi:phage tail protein [Bradyrhizobium tropiciagri]|uniref:phage tail protein n=1 Tax=Bradyrhizobium tropiciagri TaxID=312253 RepID=UPI001BA99F38|nr:tail fiber protein [Bradyrhizobium tropiciagri]MBR0899288.1 phage tail protein [Bradyrhizobium tropiciagri]
MAQPYVGEIRLFAGNFAPAGWMFCDGSLLPISNYDTLFNLIGTTYGGDGQSTFQLPDLRGRVPIHIGPGFPIAASGGVENVTLTVSQIPSHSHSFMGSTDVANSPNPAGNVIGRSPQIKAFLSSTPGVQMSGQFLANTGGSQPHDNFQPYLCVDFIISLFGIYPSQT